MDSNYNMDKREIWAAIVFISIFAIQYIDDVYTNPKMKESAVISEIQCKQSKDLCWIQEKKK